MSKSWREVYFNKKSCNGVVLNEGNGNIKIRGETKTKGPATVIFWASSPPNFRSSYSGSGLPYHSPEQAFDRSPNVGAVKSKDGTFEFNIFYPNAYYVGLGSLYVPPQVHIKVCNNDGIEHEYKEWEDLWHVFQIEAMLPESVESFKMFGNFLNKHIGVKV